MNEKHYMQMYQALQRITKYRTPKQIERDAKRMGIGEIDYLQTAYAHFLDEAKAGLKRVRKPTSPTCIQGGAGD